MEYKVSEERKWEIIGYVKVSKPRFLTLMSLKDEFLMPSEIGKKTGMRTTQASNALQELKKVDLVICKNENSYRGRIYQATPLGLEILSIIEEGRKP